MCLINLHFQEHPKYKLVIVANRDEEYSRPTKAAHYWEDQPNILAGRDLKEMGTWLGVSKQGKFAALTNFRDPTLPSAPMSRGEIVKSFLENDVHPSDFIKQLAHNRKLYGGYNVIVGNGDELYHYNNILTEFNQLVPGTYSLSNSSLNTPWPKVEKGRSRLRNYVEANENHFNINDLFHILSDRTKASDDELPNTGVGLNLERELSSMFIQMPHYGTRSSTVVLFDWQHQITFVERTYREGQFLFDKAFEFSIEE
nr:NRDE family protein [Lysinibacillus timonensis]